MIIIIKKMETRPQINIQGKVSEAVARSEAAGRAEDNGEWGRVSRAGKAKIYL